MIVALLGTAPSHPAWAGGQGGHSAPAASVARMVTVHNAANFCRLHATGRYQVSIRGFFVLTFNPGVLHEGAIFDTAEVPVSAASNGHWKDFGGLGVQIASPPTVPSWLRMMSTLACSHGVPLLTVRAWKVTSPPPPEVIPTVTGLLRVSSAVALCSRGTGARYRLHLRGIFHAITPSLYLDDGRVGVLKVDASASHLLPRSVPNGGRVVLYGLLACTMRAPEFEVYSWRTIRT